MSDDLTPAMCHALGAFKRIHRDYMTAYKFERMVDFDEMEPQSVMDALRGLQLISFSRGGYVKLTDKGQRMLRQIENRGQVGGVKVTAAMRAAGVEALQPPTPVPETELSLVERVYRAMVAAKTGEM